MTGASAKRMRAIDAVDGAEVLGITVLLLGLSWSEAAKSIGLALAVLALSVRLALGGRIRLPESRTLALLGCLLIAAALSVAVAQEDLSRPRELLTLAMTVVAFPLVFDVCARRPSRRVLLTYTIIAGAAVGALLGYGEHMAGEYKRLVLPSIENAIPAGEYLAAVLGLGVAMVAAEGGATVAGPALGFSVGLFSLVMVMTKSRGPLLGAGASVLLAMAVGSARRRLAIVVGAALLSAVALFGVLNPESRVVREGIVGSRSAVNRVKTWNEALDRFAERPLVGHGAGSFPLLGIEFVDEIGREREQNAHNLLVHQLTETGILGAGALVAFVVSALLDVVRALRRSRRGVERAITVGCLAGAAALLVCGVFSVSLDAEPGILFFALLALGASAAGAATPAPGGS